MIRLFAPLILFILFISESIFVLLAGEWFYQSYIFSPKFIFIALLFLAFYGPKKYFFGFSIFFGLLTDIVYSEVIGIYLLAFPALCYVVHFIKSVVQNNYFIALFISLVGISLLEFFSFLVNTVIRITSMPIDEFLFVRLIPTLIFNFVFLLVAMVPLRKMAEKIKLSVDK